MFRYSVLVAGIIATSFVSIPQSARAAEATAWLDKHLDDLLDLYKHLHEHPELSFQEKETAARIAQELKDVGCEVTTGVGKLGVVGLLKNGDGPTVMLRTDLDALPVPEKTDLVYASKVKATDENGKETPVMHACGHDIHMTNLVGTARYMAAHKSLWSGTVMFIGQPAEERGGGAKAMLDDGLFTRFPKPKYALALHVSPSLPAGSVGYRAGYALANVDSVDVTFYGRGGHGAQPHTTVDPIVLAAHFIVDLQSVVAREIKPGEPAVITVGSIHGGTKHNIIGDVCELQLTVRSYASETRKHLEDAIRRKAKACAESFRATEPKVVFGEGTPATFNDKALVDRVVPVLKRTLGDSNVREVDPSMGGEDFSMYGLAGVPIFMFSVGSIDKQRLAGLDRLKQDPPSLHSPFYYPDAEATLRTGISAMTAALIDLLPPAETKAAATP